MSRYKPMTPGHGLLAAWVPGAGRLDVPSIKAAAGHDAPWRWLHLDANSEATKAWVRHAAGDDRYVADILLAEETRPSCDATTGRIVAVLRGVNLDPNARPEDMVSVRVWLTQDRLVTAILRRVRACEDIVERLHAGTDPAPDPQRILELLNRRLADRMTPTIESLSTELDTIYQRIIDESDPVTTGELVQQRSTAIGLSRYLGPLADSTDQLAEAECEWLGDRFRASTRDTAGRFRRITEDLLALQARAALARDEIVSQNGDRLNQRVYTLTVIAAIFLPLSVLTGLLGMNVGGIPLLEHPSGFWIVLAGLTAAAVAVIGILRWARWL